MFMIAEENKCILKVQVKKMGLNCLFIIVNVINNILFCLVLFLCKNDNVTLYFFRSLDTMFQHFKESPQVKSR